MSIDSSIMYQQFILNFYTSLNLSNSKLIDTCYKMGNYDFLNYFLENIAKTVGADIKFAYSIFNERNPSYPNVPSIKEIIESSRFNLVKGDITIDDFGNVLKSKDDTIKDITAKLTTYEKVINNLNSTVFQYEKNIIQLRSEINKKNLQLAAYNTNVYFQPNLIISSPSSIEKDDFPPLVSQNSSPTKFTGSCFKPETKLKGSLLDIFKNDIWKSPAKF